MPRKTATTFEAIILLTLIISLVGIGVHLKVGMQVPLFLSWFILLLYGHFKGASVQEMENAGYGMIRDGFGALMIILSTGGLIGTWIAAGTVPSLIYYGLQFINPHFFLLTTIVFCSIVSICTGTSYGTVGTAGLAMVAVGSAMGIPSGMIAGAVISGALFGDKLSAISDTTNLAAGITGTNLYDHIKHMLFTTVPAYLITATIFTVMGFKYGTASLDSPVIHEIVNALQAHFSIGLIQLIPLVVVIALLLRRVPALLAIMVGVVIGAVFAILFQGTSLKDILQYMWSGYHFDLDSPFLAKILNRGGLKNMLGIFLVGILGMGMGGILDHLGLLNAIMEAIVKKARSVGNLILSTCIVSYLVGMVAGTVNFAIVMAGTIFRPIYKERGLASRNLSRTLEDSCTMGGVFFPWHANAIFFAGALGVAWESYIPFCFLSFITPMFTLLYGYTNRFIMTLEQEKNLSSHSSQPDSGSAVAGR